MAFCHPFDDLAVIAGQGTLGLELVEDLPDLSCVIVPVGGGGLASGLAIAVKSQLPHVRVIGVQAAVCAPYAGGSSPDGPVVTLADGIAVKRPGELTAPLIGEWVDELVAVDEDAIADAMVLLMDRAKLYVEGPVRSASPRCRRASWRRRRAGRRAWCCPAATSTWGSCPG